MTDIYSADEDDFGRELIGKRIVALTPTHATLDDNTVLAIQAGGDCCAWFEGAFRVVDLNDNAITSVERVERDSDGGIDRWSLNIYTAHKQIAAVDIEGNEGSGYYGHSINLQISRPAAAK